MILKINKRTIPDEFKYLVKVLKTQNHQEFKFSNNQGLMCIAPYADNWDIITGVFYTGCWNRYCYRSLEGAIKYFEQWENNSFLDEPQGFYQSITNPMVSQLIDGKVYHFFGKN